MIIAYCMCYLRGKICIIILPQFIYRLPPLPPSSLDSMTRGLEDSRIRGLEDGERGLGRPVAPCGLLKSDLAADCYPYNPLVQEWQTGSIESFDVVGFA